MGELTKISWTDHTWNPFIGCSKISAGCKNCYFYREGHHYGFDPTIVRKSGQMQKPLKWRIPALVFTCSWSDFFHKDIHAEWLNEAWDIIRQTKHLTYQILTKRPDLILDRLPADWGDGWPNVWLGVTVEHARYVDRLDILSKIPAVLRFASFEPALGPLDGIPTLWADSVKWWIAGGESGPGFRAPKREWFIAMRDECMASGLAFFFKQWGGVKKIDGDWGGNLLEGRKYHEFPKVKNAFVKISQLAMMLKEANSDVRTDL